jgi:hypothetical protein
MLRLLRELRDQMPPTPESKWRVIQGIGFIVVIVSMIGALGTYIGEEGGWFVSGALGILMLLAGTFGTWWHRG